MNTIAGTGENGGKFLMLVLEPANLHRLQRGEPILVHIEDMYPDGIPKRLDLRILFSATPIADARELADVAEVTLDERTPVSKSKRPHCPECRSTIEQLGMLTNAPPVDIVFCPQCGCVLGVARAKEVAA